MAKIKVEDIVGLRIIPRGDIVCWDCLSEEERQDFNEDDVIMADETESDDEIYFCDRCKKRM